MSVEVGSRLSWKQDGFPPLLVLAWGQGLYYLISGIWPLVHMRSFLAVTGPKTDLWLVQTVGVLIVVIALTILLGAWRREVDAVVVFLAVASAFALAMVDTVFVTKGRIAPIYLGDAVVELMLVAAWIWAAT